MKAKILIWVCFLAGLFQINGLFGQLSCHKILTPAELQEDFHVFRSLLETVHPNLYRVTSKDKLDKHFHAFEKTLDQPQSYLEFLKGIATLLTDIGDIATQWGHARAYIDYRNAQIPIFPLKMEIRDQRFFVTHTFNGDASWQPGTEILAIDGEKIPHYLRKNYALLPTDGKIRTIQERWLEAYFPMHHSNFWSQAETFELLIKTPEGKQEKRSLSAIKRSDFKAAIPDFANSRRPFSFEYRDDIPVLTISELPSKEDSSWNYQIDSVFNQLTLGRDSLLILDLRGAGTVNISQALYLFCYLTDPGQQFAESIRHRNFLESELPVPALSGEDFYPILGIDKPIICPPNRYSGKLVVICNGWTMAARAFLCNRLASRKNTWIAGETPGQEMQGFNDCISQWRLPNSLINIYIPKVFWQGEIATDSGKRVLDIDFPVSGENQGKAVLEQVLEWAKKLK